MNYDRRYWQYVKQMVIDLVQSGELTPGEAFRIFRVDRYLIVEGLKERGVSMRDLHKKPAATAPA